jgi:hypothetical protein
MADCTVFQCERRVKGARISIRGVYLILMSKKNKSLEKVVGQEIPAADVENSLVIIEAKIGNTSL